MKLLHPGNIRRIRFLIALAAISLCLASTMVFAQLDSDTPTPIGPFLGGALPSMNPNGQSGTWDVVPAFPNLPVSSPLAIEANPSNGDLWVASLRGKIEAFTPDPNTSQKQLIVDLENRTSREGGMIGIAFHPEFGMANSPGKNYFFIYYASVCALNDQLSQVDLSNCVTLPAPGDRAGFYGAYLRLSRFEYDEGMSPQQVRDSEIPLINIRLFNNSHRGGGPVFGKDGFLYLAIGEQEIPETAQDMKTNLHGGLRISVDITEDGSGGWGCPAGSHLPRRSFQNNFNNNSNPNLPGHDDELSGHYYCIPDDNPWPDPSADLNFEEYFSTGHRNPHRITVDRLTGNIWSGEVGSNRSEEVNIIERGKNYGWPCREGYANKPGFITMPYCQATQTGVLTDPVIDFNRDEANALIGGYVYRGNKYPELYGKYLAGDWVLGHIYAVSYDHASGVASKMRLTTWDPRALATWGQDLEGELYLGYIGKTLPLYTLNRLTNPTPEPPATLFETGAFSDLVNLEPASYWLPYDLNQPFWSDGAIKSRWIAIPENETIEFSETGNWNFPVGTVIMKHFELAVDETDNTIRKRLETRFMVHGEDQWYGITYRWNDLHTDASLLADSESVDIEILTPGGGMRVQTWDFPSRSDCLFCHNSSVAGVAGVRTHTINGDYTYPTGITRNQLLAWNQLGWFSPALDPAFISGYLKSVPVNDTGFPLEDRARSWLDINCSNCHRPGGPGDRAPFDLRLTTPLVLQNVINGPVLETLGLPNESLITPKCITCSVIYQRVAAIDEIAMPPLAKQLVENEAVSVLEEWINSIDDIPIGDACGRPGYSPSADRAILLWQNCDGDGSWHLRVSGGTGPLVTAAGDVFTDQTFTNVSSFRLEANDILNAAPNRIDFTMFAGKRGQDGIDFSVASGNTCLTLDPAGGMDVLVGVNRLAVTPPFNIQTLAGCDNGGQPQLSIDDVQISEAAGTAVLNVTLSASSTSTVTVDFHTQNSSAESGEDYISNSGTLVFNPGMTSVPVMINIIQDSDFEGPETFNVILGNSTNASISGFSGTVTIEDDDTPVGSACGRPGYSPSADRAILLWQNCDGDGSWHLRVSGGTGPLVTAAGDVFTDQTFTNVSSFRLEANDILNAAPNRIDFTMFAGKRGQDGIDFSVASGNTCLTLDPVAGMDVQVGENRLAVAPPFNIQTLGGCN